MSAVFAGELGGWTAGIEFVKYRDHLRFGVASLARVGLLCWPSWPETHNSRWTGFRGSNPLRPPRHPREYDPTLAVKVRRHERKRSRTAKQLEAGNAQMQRIIARQTVKIDAIEC